MRTIARLVLIFVSCVLLISTASAQTCPDADGDGRRSAACGGDDCDDHDAGRFPGNVEVCDADQHDEDCDPATFGFRDEDQDGVVDARCCNLDQAGQPAWTSGGTRSSIFPDAGFSGPKATERTLLNSRQATRSGVRSRSS